MAQVVEEGARDPAETDEFRHNVFREKKSSHHSSQVAVGHLHQGRPQNGTLEVGAIAHLLISLAESV